jgi:hypothetical protein
LSSVAKFVQFYILINNNFNLRLLGLYLLSRYFGAMITSYDPTQIIEKALRWREKAAVAVDVAYRDECLRRAVSYEQLVVRSREIPAVEDSADRRRLPLSAP